MRGFLAFAAALALAACGSSGRPGTPEAEQVLREVNARYDRAIVAADKAALEEILADDYVYVTANAEVRDRAATIAHHTSGRLRVASQGSEDVAIRWLGDHALVVGRFRATVTMGGADFPIDERYSSIWALQDGRWRLRHEHASEVPQQR
ncbi:nuclear transport factor 2 family protein [Allosphingosinicella sp.]|uniref:nuclear transport factor 2 family protein n=1 Tax=Allosphingosinicella sp. TaxID=2823234 RepID=UPI003D75FA88